MKKRIILILYILLIIILLLMLVFLINIQKIEGKNPNIILEQDFFSQSRGIYLIQENLEDIEEEILDDFEVPEQQKSNHNKKDDSKESNCISNSECKEDFTTENYCWFGKVYKNVHNFSCNNKCEENIKRELLEVCELGCSDGQCVNFFEFDCTKDYECEISDFFGETFCVDEDVHQKYKTWTCNNPGTEDSFCSFENKVKLTEQCLTNLICSENIGRCVEI